MYQVQDTFANTEVIAVLWLDKYIRIFVTQNTWALNNYWESLELLIITVFEAWLADLAAHATCMYVNLQ